MAGNFTIVFWINLANETHGYVILYSNSIEVIVVVVQSDEAFLWLETNNCMTALSMEPNLLLSQYTGTGWYQTVAILTFDKGQNCFQSWYYNITFPRKKVDSGEITNPPSAPWRGLITPCVRERHCVLKLQTTLYRVWCNFNSNNTNNNVHTYVL